MGGGFGNGRGFTIFSAASLNLFTSRGSRDDCEIVGAGLGWVALG
jgi:hypothetical protein